MLLDLLELSVNNALRYDPASQQRLATLQGKTITLEIKPTEQPISVHIHPDELEFSSDTEDNSDVTLRATVGALIKIGRDGMDKAQLEPGELEINGDPIVGQRFASVLAELDVDWQALLAEHIGEAPAALVSVGLGKVKEVAESSKPILTQHIKNVLKNDMQLVADKTQVESFLDEVDDLRADVERLAARLKKLQQTD